MIASTILAGGVSFSVGAGTPKRFVEMLDNPVLSYTIEFFEKYPVADAIEIASHKSWKDYLNDMIEMYRYKRFKWIAGSSETFQISVICGVNNLKDIISGDAYALIQYVEAPFTSEKIVTDVIHVMKENSALVTVTPCFQLLGSMDGEIYNIWVDRDKYTQITCPYGFKYTYMLDKNKRAEEKSLITVIELYTTSLMYAHLEKLNLVYGDQTNIKITVKQDLDIFERYVLTN